MNYEGKMAQCSRSYKNVAQRLEVAKSSFRVSKGYIFSKFLKQSICALRQGFADSNRTNALRSTNG